MPGYPRLPILSSPQPADSIVRENRDAYWALGAAAAVLLTLLGMFFAASRASASFWPFSTTAAASPSPVLHDPEMLLLRAAVNIDPNPSKGENGVAISGGSALLADAGPDGTAANIEDGPKSGRISLYVVRVGDTLSAVADMFDVSINTVLWANNLKSARDIHPGDTLLILPVSGIKHTVAKGETLSSLAKKYGADADDIAAFNGLDSAIQLAVGSELIIPGGELPLPKVAVPTSAFRGGGGTALSGFFLNPVPGSVVSQGLHGWNGIDLAAKSGTPIHASAAGTVIVSRSSGWNGGYGSYVVIDHGNGVQTLYSHMSRDIVGVGQRVSSGEVIGYVGATGRATGAHLHFEVRGAQNPLASCALRTACTPK